MSKCKSCGAEIRWVETEGGKRMPLDMVADADGNMTIDQRRDMEDHATAIDVGVPVGLFTDMAAPRYVPHFATCPQAGDWRK